MHKLSIIVLLFMGYLPLMAQSPHGDDLKMDCIQCHNPSGWTMDYQTIQFDHDKTEFQLEGTHVLTDCTQCHSSLIFDQAPLQCISCHTDVHSQSVGNDCVRCHTTESWIVDNIPELHEENGFPLIGSHSNLSCIECHTSDSNQRFDRIGNECINCHREDYVGTQNPNHETSGYSTNCIVCHNPLGYGWDAENINHAFFPLTQGHDIQDCNQCHTGEGFSGLSPECVNCHLEDYTGTQNPNHQTSGFSTDCAACHSLNPGWTPAVFDHDGQYFPIYSGKHQGEWNDCIDCHNNPNDYAQFSCFECHGQSETNNDHSEVNDYEYVSAACLECHPSGDD